MRLFHLPTRMERSLLQLGLVVEAGDILDPDAPPMVQQPFVIPHGLYVVATTPHMYHAVNTARSTNRHNPYILPTHNEEFVQSQNFFYMKLYA